VEIRRSGKRLKDHMRILQLHSDFIEYTPIKKEVATAEAAEKRPNRLEDLVVLFTCVEEGDTEAVAKQAVAQINEVLKKLKAKRILIYPYAHLSSSLAKPAAALKILKAMEKYAREAGIETFRSPFGWNKQFSLSIKGHPLAEQLRIITPVREKEGKAEEKVSEALKIEETMKSTWFIMDTDGKLTPVEKFNFKGHEMLQKFAKYEMAKVRAVQQTPPHVTLMKRLGLTDYEFGSDPGNFRWPPKGRLVKSLLERFVTQTVTEYGGMEVETPVMYDLNHPSLAAYVERFPARQYIVKSEDRELFLRFAACFGQFLMSHDTQISYKQLPFRIYELTRYSFRREQSGELVGLRRLRAFTMPDCHAMCADLDQAKKEFMVRFDLCTRNMKEGLEFTPEDYELGVRFTMEFYEENKIFIVSLVKKFGKPTLIELLPKRYAYWILKYEFNFVDNLDKASALSTDQIDVENAETYDISYNDEQGKKKRPLILHCSPSGSIERCVYALLEKAYREQQQGRVPILPTWLAPTQVRVIPLSDKFVTEAEKIAEKLNETCVRADVDDRPLTMQKKVREAETEWVNFVVVIGEREITSGVLPVRDRKLRKIRQMELQELAETVRKDTEGKPFLPLTLPKLLSKRPVF
jgi:threonyl-tRNA synthetase